jgi:hypothetical protein
MKLAGWIALSTIVVVAGCREKTGPARPLPTPVIDTVNALRTGFDNLSPRIANYTIDAHFDPATHTITATQTLLWKNTSASSVDVLPFHLYLNAFKNDQSLFMLSSGGMLRSQRATNHWGFINVESIQVEGSELVSKLRFPGPALDRTVAELPLASPVAPGTSIEVTMRFVAQLPEVFARTGYQGDFHMVGQWFPKIGVLVGTPGFERWDCVPFHGNAEFFADFGSYDVDITAPTSYAIAATGVLRSVKDDPSGQRTHHFHADDVHDFAWMADPFMLQLKANAHIDSGTVEVRVWYRSEQISYARRHLTAAVGTIEHMSKLLTPYPYSILTVIDPPPEAADGAGGMEYPTLVTTAGDHALARRGLRLPEFVTVHEVGHQWFQGMLASNEHSEAWLDEGINEWIDGHVMSKLFGEPGNAIDWMKWQADVTAFRRAVANPEAEVSPIATSPDAFSSFASYGSVTYETTLFAMMTLENIVGSEKFMAAMQQYAKRFSFKHPTGADLFAVWREQLGDLGWFTEAAFTQLGGSDLSVGKVACSELTPPRGIFDDEKGHRVLTAETAPSTGAFRCEVVVNNRGSLLVPVTVEIVFADGTSERMQWPANSGHWQRFLVQRNAPIAEVHIDPDRLLVTDAPMNNSWRVVADTSASFRAGARAAFWAQSIMQVVGL